MSGDDRGLAARISKADRQALAALVANELTRFTERDALQALRHPHASEAMIEEILSSKTLLAFRGVRRLVAAHPLTPRHAALRCLEDLLWRDLLDVGREARTPPPVRAAANRKLEEALRFLAVGEKIAVARFASSALFPALLDEPDVRVLEAVFANSRLMTEDIQRWLATGHPRPEALALLSRDPRWATRPAVRIALLTHRATPRAAALSLLTSASRGEWRRLAEDPNADALLSACARNLLENGSKDVDRTGKSP
ncbi:MAG TPA: hypothetical protein VF554_13435 [Thermoanaerobaculia bacterium]